MKVTLIGIDLAKSIFQVCGVNQAGKRVLNRQVRRVKPKPMKRRNRYLRRLLIQGAWSVMKYADKSDDRLSRWARQLIARRDKHKAVVAVANKMARIMWSMLYHQTEFRAN